MCHCTLPWLYFPKQQQQHVNKYLIDPIIFFFCRQLYFYIFMLYPHHVMLICCMIQGIGHILIQSINSFSFDLFRKTFDDGRKSSTVSVSSEQVSVFNITQLIYLRCHSQQLQFFTIIEINNQDFIKNNSFSQNLFPIQASSVQGKIHIKM